MTVSSWLRWAKRPEVSETAKAVFAERFPKTDEFYEDTDDNYDDEDG